MTRAGRKVRPRFSRCFHQWNRCLLLRKLSATNEYMSPQGHVRQGSWTKEGAPEILRCAQDDKTPGCHPFASLRAGVFARALGLARRPHRSFAALRMTCRTLLKAVKDDMQDRSQ